MSVAAARRRVLLFIQTVDYVMRSLALSCKADPPRPHGGTVLMLDSNVGSSLGTNSSDGRIPEYSSGFANDLSVCGAPSHHALRENPLMW